MPNNTKAKSAKKGLFEIRMDNVVGQEQIEDCEGLERKSFG